MAVDKDLVRHVADLAKLALSDEEVAQFVPELQAILAYVARVSAIEVDEAPEDALLPPVGIDALRADEVGTTLPLHDLMRQAPDSDGAFFVVPKFLAEGEGDAS